MGVSCARHSIQNQISKSSMTSSIETQLGICTGKNGDGVVQYLGIKYASLEDQMSAPNLLHGYGAEIVDATKFG